MAAAAQRNDKESLHGTNGADWDDTNEKKFLQWCAVRDIQAPNVRIAQFGRDLRGVAAQSSIEPGSVIVRVPEKALLSVRTVQLYPQFDQALRALDSVPDERVVFSCLILWLAAAKPGTPAHDWNHYLKVLPKEYTILGSFPADLEDEFQACYRARLATKTDYESAQPLLERLQLPAKFKRWQAWLFAAGAVASRTMHFPGLTVGCLTPFGDMHNYQPPPAPALPSFGNGASKERHFLTADKDVEGAPEGGVEAWEGVAGSGEFDAEKREYIITAGRRYADGDQVLLCYGRYTNIEMLEHYGFLLPDNPHDEVVVPRELWPMQGKASEDQSWFFHPGGCPSWALLQALRRHFCTPQERNCVEQAATGEMISARNEVQVFECISEVCLQVLSTMPTTTKQDQQALDSKSASSQRAASEPNAPTFHDQCLQLAIQWRMHHKRALAWAVKQAQCARAALLKLAEK